MDICRTYVILSDASHLFSYGNRLRDLARRQSELRRALTLAGRPSGLRHALDSAGLVQSLSPASLGRDAVPMSP